MQKQTNTKIHTMKNSILRFEADKVENLETLVGGGGNSSCKPKKCKGNNGFGNGSDDPAPGNSGSTGQDKEDDIVR